MDEELSTAIENVLIEISFEARISDLIYPILEAVRSERTLSQVIQELKISRQRFQDMSDVLGRLAVAMQQNPQAIIDLQRSLENERANT